MDGFLTKQDILGFATLKTEDVVVPQWGGKLVRIREMTAKERDDYEQSCMQARMVGDKMQVTPNLSNAKARLVVKCLVDPDSGKRLFTDGEAESLGQLSAAAVDMLATRISTLSGMRKQDVERLEKNSGNAPGDGSPSE